MKCANFTRWYAYLNCVGDRDSMILRRKILVAFHLMDNCNRYCKTSTDEKPCEVMQILNTFNEWYAVSETIVSKHDAKRCISN